LERMPVLLRKNGGVEGKDLAGGKYRNIVEAAREGDTAAVKGFLNTSVAPETLDDYWKMTALEWAVIRGNSEMLQLLLAAAGAEKQPFCAALEDAIAYKRPDMAAVLASPCGRSEGPDALNHRNLLINAAAERGMLSVVKAMVEAGFSVSSAGVPNERKGQMIDARPFRPLSWQRSRGPVAARPLDKAGTAAVADYLIEHLGGATKETALDAIANGQSSRLKHILRLRPELAEQVGICSGAAFRLLNSRTGNQVLSVFAAHGADFRGTSAECRSYSE
jgi:hypothetical protein